MPKDVARQAGVTGVPAMEVSCGLAVASCDSCGPPAGELMLSSEGDGGKWGSAEEGAGWLGVLGLQVLLVPADLGESCVSGALMDTSTVLQL